VDARGGLRLTFSGRQPENCEFLAQLVPLAENLHFELSVAYRTGDIAAASGLTWRVSDAASGEALLATGSLSSEDGERRSFRFRTPAAHTLARLALLYRRSPGTTRIEGYITIREVDLRPVLGTS